MSSAADSISFPKRTDFTALFRMLLTFFGEVDEVDERVEVNRNRCKHIDVNEYKK